MPKGRMLNKSISVDEEVAKLSDRTIILYTWCIPHLDVDGKILADTQVLKGVVIPYLNKFTFKVIEICVNELSLSPLVCVYSNGHKYMKFMGFGKNQTLNKDREAPSEIPDPTPEQLQSKSGVTPAEVNISKYKLSKEKDSETVKEFFNYFLLKTKKDFKLTPGRRDLIDRRLNEGRTLEELKRAVDNFILDDWPDRKKYSDLVYCIGVRNKIDNLDKWLNIKTAEPTRRQL